MTNLSGIPVRKRLYDLIDFDADDRIGRSCHAYIGYVGGPLRKYLFICSLHMRMSSDDSAYLAVYKVTEGDFFRGRLCMKIDDYDIGLFF